MVSVDVKQHFNQPAKSACKKKGGGGLLLLFLFFILFFKLDGFHYPLQDLRHANQQRVHAKSGGVVVVVVFSFLYFFLIRRIPLSIARFAACQALPLVIPFFSQI